jgi:uncharacterized protein (DUF4415 family)
MKSQTDLNRVRNMKDEDIDYSDIPATTDEELSRATRRGKPLKIPISLRLEASVLYKLRKSGKGWQTRLSKKITSLVMRGIL